jgi:hypothetical protein
MALYLIFWALDHLSYVPVDAFAVSHYGSLQTGRQNYLYMGPSFFSYATSFMRYFCSLPQYGFTDTALRFRGFSLPRKSSETTQAQCLVSPLTGDVKSGNAATVAT